MTKREYIAILLGTLCFVLMTAGLSYTTLNLYTSLFMSLLSALEVGWLCYAPKAWRTAHTITFPEKVTISGTWIYSAITNVLHYTLYWGGLMICLLLLLSSGFAWFGTIAPHMPNNPMTAWVFGSVGTIVGMVILFFCISLTEDSAPPADIWVGTVLFELGKALGAALLGSIVFPVLVLIALLIVCVALAWAALALLIGIALLASEKQFLVVTIGIISGSTASLIFGVTPTEPIGLMLRLLVGAIAGFGSGEAVHYAGQFLARTKNGRRVTDLILIRK